MVQMFEKVGVGQWFRFVTGAFEVSGAILLLIPRLTFYGTTLLLLVMVGGVTAPDRSWGQSGSGPDSPRFERGDGVGDTDHVEEG